MKCLLLILLAAPLVTVAQQDAPKLKVESIDFQDDYQSSDPAVMGRQLSYYSSAAPAELLEYYTKSGLVEMCEPNEMAENYVCRIAEWGDIRSGHLFIDRHAKNGRVEVFMDYFFTLRKSVD